MLLLLALLSLAQLMIVLDFSIVNVALPSIQAQFALSPTELQWVVSAYACVAVSQIEAAIIESVRKDRW